MKYLFNRVQYSLFLFFCCTYLCGCYVLPLNSAYTGPPERPQSLLDTYRHSSQYTKSEDQVLQTEDEYTIRRITLDTEAGETKIDFYQGPEKRDEIIFVFPVLGGRPILSRHFASYFARRGFDTAIVHRSNEFKKPENFRILEELFHKGVLRDRIAIDYFEKEEGKSKFGTFGMSRGGINVAITAGIDERLEYNFIAMAGADLPEIFMHSNERRLQRYVKRISLQEEMTREEVFDHLKREIRTDPKYFAPYIDASKAMMVLGLCDNTVPFRHGQLLRNLIGKPRTIYSFLGHKTTVLFTQVVEIVPPFEDFCMLPPAYIESEAILFFRKAFNKGPFPWQIVPWKILQLPFNIIFQFGDWIIPDS